MAKDSSSPLPCLPVRDGEAHKGDFGTALLIGGSRGMAGAVALAGMAALKGGAGLVRLAVPDACLETVAQFDPCYMTVPLVSDRRGRISLDARQQILKQIEAATAVAIGPGMGRSLGVSALLARLYETVEQPTVIDADGLNALAARIDRLSRPAGPRILTPHPGEFARLTGSKPRSTAERTKTAAELARQLGVVVVLKGHGTVVTDGKRTTVNRTGNPGMATGGAGDVLTGLIVALLSQGLTAYDAARLGVHLHGLAGDVAEELVGEESLTASDIIEWIAEAFSRYDDVE